ncbi:MAG TPA: PQQ-binding-like beta-propeller repeat protein [Rhizomicrobium sp.]|nr:PQQ-binding-like beta-propeller repeat protein [Rhizomicrobium sp.]
MVRGKLCALLALLCTAGSVASANEWLTFGHDGERSGWNRDERTLSPKTVPGLKLLWQTQLPVTVKDVALASLTSPLIATGIATAQGKRDLLFTVGMDDSLSALDAASGAVVWRKTFAHDLKPLRAANVNCSNTEQATPAIDKAKGVIYFTTSDGKLRGVALGDGAERLTPTQFVAPFSRNWSLNLIDGVVYTAAGRGCGGSAEQAIEPGTVAAMDVRDPAHPVLSRFLTSKGRPAGPWGRGGPVKGPKGVYVQTADGPRDPDAGLFGNAVLAIGPKAQGAPDYFIPADWKALNAKDLDLGSGSPLVLSFAGRDLLATSSKDAVVFLLDANSLGGSDHATALYTSPRLGNEAGEYYAQGVWGGISAYQTPKGETYLYVPMWGPKAQNVSFPKSYGDAPHGSIMALRVVKTGSDFSLVPEWISHDLNLPDSVAVAGGVVFAVQTGEQAIQHPDNPEGHGRPIPGVHTLTQAELEKFRATPVAPMVLYALDALTGEELYSSKDLLKDWVHFNQPVVAGGRVFLVSHNAHVYAFGLGR